MPSVRSTLRLLLGSLVCLSVCGIARGQEAAAPPAFLAVVEGTATLERDGEVQPAVRDMPYVTGDRLRTEAGRVEIDFPDGTTIEVGSYSEVEALSPTRVRLLAGTMDHLQRRPVQTDSATYLPQGLQRYGQTFDQYGSWNYDTSYGYVWYPRVATDWRPYYYGSWSPVPTYGWTWVGLDAWSWPTHHYGRWGYARNAWFWIPGLTWSAAWVSWGLASDYVSWCPLGFDGHPVFALSVGLGGHGWNGWTVMSRNHFGYRGHYAHNYSVDPRRFDSRSPFIQTARLPLTLAHDRDRSRGRGDSRESVVDRRQRQVPQSAGVSPAAPVGVAVPRGTAANERGTTNVAPRPTNDYRRTPNDYRPVPGDYRRPPNVERRIPNAEPRTRYLEPRTPNPELRTPNRFERTPNPELRTPNPELRIPNRFDRGVPAAAPRVYQPVVPPAAAPVVPPAAPTGPAPQYRPPTPGYRVPTYDSRPPAGDSREHARPPDRAAPAERPAAAPQAVPRGTAAASDKADSGGAKRPR